MSARRTTTIRELRKSGLSKRAAKRVWHAKRSAYRSAAAPVGEYRRLAKMKRRAA